MNRVLAYRGKTIKEMTLNELTNQYKMNKLRFAYRTIFFILASISILVYDPIISIIPIFMAILTGYWIIENNNIIKKELERR